MGVKIGASSFECEQVILIGSYGSYCEPPRSGATKANSKLILSKVVLCVGSTVCDRTCKFIVKETNSANNDMIIEFTERRILGNSWVGEQILWGDCTYTNVLFLLWESLWYHDKKSNLFPYTLVEHKKTFLWPMKYPLYN